MLDEEALQEALAHAADADGCTRDERLPLVGSARHLEIQEALLAPERTTAGVLLCVPCPPHRKALSPQTTPSMTPSASRRSTTSRTGTDHAAWRPGAAAYLHRAYR